MKLMRATLALLWLTGPALLAQGFSIPGVKPTESAANEPPVDPLGRTTPRGTVKGFMRSVEREDYEQAAQFLDTRQRGQAAAELAHELGVVMNRRFLTDLNSISNLPEGNVAEDPEPGVEVIGTVVGAKGEEVQIILRRVTQAQGQRPIWLFARATLDQIPAVYKDIGSLWVEENLPAAFREKKLFGIPLWRLFLVPLLIVLAWLLGLGLGELLALVVVPLTKRAGRPLTRQALSHYLVPMRVVILGGMLAYFGRSSVSFRARQMWWSLGGILMVIGFTWLLMRMVDWVSEMLDERQARMATTSDLALRRLVQRILKIVLALIGLVALVGLFGYDPTTLIAGLGVGGVAIALAAQKTLENLIAGVVVITDKPIRVGDFIAVGAHRGDVIDIGLRSTRLRTLERTIVSIPNAQIATSVLENFAERDRFWFNPTLTLRYETTRQQMETVLGAIREMIANDPAFDQSNPLVAFKELGQSSLNVEIRAYLRVPDYPAFLMKNEQALTRIRKIVEENSPGFAFPSRTLYLEKDQAGPTPAS